MAYVTTIAQAQCLQVYPTGQLGININGSVLYPMDDSNCAYQENN